MNRFRPRVQKGWSAVPLAQCRGGNACPPSNASVHVWCRTSDACDWASVMAFVASYPGLEMAWMAVGHLVTDRTTFGGHAEGKWESRGANLPMVLTRTHRRGCWSGGDGFPHSRHHNRYPIHFPT